VLFALRLADRIGNFGLAASLIAIPTLLAAFLICWALRRHLAEIVAVTFGTIGAGTSCPHRRAAKQRKRARFRRA
jgi:hypothetical protein